MATRPSPLFEAWAAASPAGAGAEDEEYRVVPLEGAADRWSDTLNSLARDGWRLLSIVSEAGGSRAVLRRRTD